MSAATRKKSGGRAGKAPRGYILINRHDQARCRIAHSVMLAETFNTFFCIRQVQ